MQMFESFRPVQARAAAAGDKIPGVLQHLCVRQLYLLCYPVWQPFLLLLPNGLPGLCADQLVGRLQSCPLPTFRQQLPSFWYAAPTDLLQCSADFARNTQLHVHHA